MKKSIFLGLATFALLLTTSCVNEIAPSKEIGDTPVTFQIGTPEIATRAYSDGTTATELQYAVYDEGGNLLDALTVTDAKINGSTSIELQLATGNEYSIIFWAAAPNAPYTINFAEKTMTVNYQGAVCNDETRDAFYKCHTFTVRGAQTETIELKRPFAQLNIGTSDYEASKKAGYKPAYSYVKVPVSSVLNLFDGTVDNSKEVEFALSAIPTKEEFPVQGYEYISMNYLLVPADKEVVDVTFGYSENNNTVEKTRTVGSVPVQRNYRTNIYGQLLTSDVDVNVEIKPEYNEPDYNLYNVVVNEVSYTDFAEAVAKAMELNMPVEFIQNVAIDADNTILVPVGKTLTLNLNGYTLSGVSDQTGANRNMFDVRGTMTVNGANTMTRAAAEGNGCITIKHVGDNMGWNNSTNVFNVTAGGVLNIKNVYATNFGGSDMGFVAHLNNWGEVTLNVENSTLESNYVAVRVFNSGPDMNNVTIKNSTLKGTRSFWVHNYTVADFGTQEKADAHKALLNFDIFNDQANPSSDDNTFIYDEENKLGPVCYGFTNDIYFDQYGNEISQYIPIIENGVYVGAAYDPASATEVGGETVYTTIVVTEDKGMAWVAENVDDYEGFAGKTIKLATDIDLGGNFAPIGYTADAVFKGTFDGNGKTIKNFKQQDLGGGYTQSVGLFSKVEDATIKNLTIEDFVAAKYGAEAGAIASIATGESTFENIQVKDGSVVAYNNDASAIVGWVTGNATLTFKDITIAEDVTVHSLWDSYDTSVGGVIGTLDTGCTVTFENINVNCKLDVYNDICSNYQWGAYRRAGMLIGNVKTTQTINGINYPNPAASGLTCKNVTVTYGTWMNYHYCEFKENGHGSYDDEYTWKHSRVEASDWGSDGVDINECTHESFESHNVCYPVDQLFGGGQGVYGLATYEGVTVNYPAEYTCSLCGKKHNATSNE